MKLYLISQDVNSDYDTYSDAVVCAESPEDAKTIHPSGRRVFPVDPDDDYDWGDWGKDLDDIKCEEIGEANSNQQRGVICASFHAG